MSEKYFLLLQYNILSTDKGQLGPAHSGNHIRNSIVATRGPWKHTTKLECMPRICHDFTWMTGQSVSSPNTPVSLQRSFLLIGCSLCLLLVAALPGKQLFTPGCWHFEIVSWHWKHTHTPTHLNTEQACKSNPNTLTRSHLSSRSYANTHKWLGGKYYFILSIFKSRDDRKGEGERHTQPLWFQVELCASVCEVNKLLQPCYQADDRQMEWIKSWRMRDRKWVWSLGFFFKQQEKKKSLLFGHEFNWCLL